jgi:hypothetical protein
VPEVLVMWMDQDMQRQSCQGATQQQNQEQRYGSFLQAH